MRLAHFMMDDDNDIQPMEAIAISRNALMAFRLIILNIEYTIKSRQVSQHKLQSDIHSTLSCAHIIIISATSRLEEASVTVLRYKDECQKLLGGGRNAIKSILSQGHVSPNSYQSFDFGRALPEILLERRKKITIYLSPLYGPIHTHHLCTLSDCDGTPQSRTSTTDTAAEFASQILSVLSKSVVRLSRNRDLKLSVFFSHIFFNLLPTGSRC